MPSAGSVSLDMKPLRQLRNQLTKASKSEVDVGIFSENTARRDDELTNAEVGFKNETGAGVPTRSFLRMPLMQKLGTQIAENAPWVFQPLQEEADVKKTLERVGFQAEAVIREAFDTQGFGKWPDNSPQTVAIKGRNEPLVDTTQLRESISSRVK